MSSHNESGTILNLTDKDNTKITVEIWGGKATGLKREPDFFGMKRFGSFFSLRREKMKDLSRECYVAVVLVCFLVLGLASATLAEHLPQIAENESNNNVFKAAVSEFLRKSNNVENLPDIRNKKIRKKVLGEAARKFFSNQDEPIEANAYFFTDLDTEQPWFRGWYTRITGINGSSIAVIGATQYIPSQVTEDDYLPGYLAIIVQELGQDVKIYEKFPEKTAFWTNRDLVLDDPASSLWEEFSWCVVEDDECTDEITHEKVAVAAHNEVLGETLELNAILGPRLTYNSNIQWLGPEAMVEFLQTVPLHWFVYSLGSVAEYTYGADCAEDDPCFGYAHQESNWGSVFPPAWIWSEGIISNNTHQYALSGGELNLGGHTLTTWLAAYHSPRIQWEFRPTLPGTIYTADINACTGDFTLIAEDAIRKLEIHVIAEDQESFIQVSVPTVEGFSYGAKESFSAEVTIKAYVKLPWFDCLVDVSIFDNAALEFGGGYMCEQP